LACSCQSKVKKKNNKANPTAGEKGDRTEFIFIFILGLSVFLFAVCMSERSSGVTRVLVKVEGLNSGGQFILFF